MCLNLPDLDRRTLEKGEHLGFEWRVVVNRMGYRCGYVRVLPDHPWFGKGYDADPLADVDVHGGLTFTAAGTPCPTHGADAEWWVGFDCAHGMDRPDPALPGYEARHDMFADERFTGYPAEVRTAEYVRAQCESLCEQAAEAQAAVTHA